MLPGWPCMCSSCLRPIAFYHKQPTLVQALPTRCVEIVRDVRGVCECFGLRKERGPGGRLWVVLMSSASEQAAATAGIILPPCPRPFLAPLFCLPRPPPLSYHH